MTYGAFSPPLLPSSTHLGGSLGGVGGFRDGAVFVMQHRIVDVSHVEDDGAERLN